MVSLIFMLTVTWVLAIPLLMLHFHSPRWGFSPLLVMLGALTAFIQSQLGIYIEPFPNLTMFISSNFLVSLVLMCILVLYVNNGTHPTRLTIYSILGVTLLSLFMLLVYRAVLRLPDSGSTANLPPDELVRPLNPRITLASFVAFTVDMYVIVIVYQGIRNHVAWLTKGGAVVLALVASAWSDAVAFHLFADLGTADFVTFLPGSVVGKTLVMLALAPLAAFYLETISPPVAEVSIVKRRTFDLLFGTVEEIRQALLITRAQLAEKEVELQREAAYFRQIAENVTEAFWLAEPHKLNSFYVNPAYEKIWGRSAASLYADHNAFVDSLHPEDKERILAGITNLTKGNYEVEYRILRPDGTIRWVRDRAFPIFNEKGELYRIAGISEDITERQLLQKQSLELAVEREKVKLLRDFIGEATHDLKSPLTAINLKLHQLARADDKHKRQHHLQDMGGMVERMKRMIDDLMTLARLENMSELQVAQVNFKELLQNISVTIHPLVQAKELSLSLEIAEAQPTLEADPVDLGRALANLVENAVRYTLEGGEVRVQTQMAEGEYIIRVSDTGIGIAPEDQPHIYNRFFRATNAKFTDDMGTGLGLAIVKKVVERHRGRLELHSELNVGTTFTVYLPRKN